MEPLLIIIRGNSGSGKTSLAKKLQLELKPAMVVSQDIVRREILKTKDTTNNEAIGLIASLALYARSINYTVIVEGILSHDKYSSMLRMIIGHYPHHLIYYIDVPFEETLRRHATKPNAHEFGETEMKQWWRDNDTLGVPGEKILPGSLDLDDMVRVVLEDSQTTVYEKGHESS